MHDETPDPQPDRPARRPRLLALGVTAALLLTAGGVGGALALAGGPTSASAAPSGTRWGERGPGGWGGGAGVAGPGSGGGRGTDSSASVDSTAADAAQSRGVVTIDSRLGYSGAASAGTGIVLTGSGRVLTNNHVIEGATTIRVTDETTGRTYSAEVVGTVTDEDVAVLQLSGASGLATAAIAEGTVAVGDDVVAVGNADGTGTLTAAEGTVTRTDRRITTEAEGTSPGETLDGLIETDADVVTGDSGGPLLDEDGAVVGVNTAATSGSAEISGYAIPIRTALDAAERILAGVETDGVTIGLPAFLGVSLAGDGNGAVVAEAVDGTPAATLGLRAGDVITAVGGTPVTSAEGLSAAIATHDPGDRVTVAWTDGAGAARTGTAVLVEGPAD